MKTIGIYGGEAFPVYTIHSNGFTEIEVSEEQLAEWKKVFESFTKMQDEIIQAMKDQGKGDNVWSANGTWNGYHIYEEDEEI